MVAETVDVLVLGAGVAGLAAGAELGERAVVLERDRRPGGLVKTECFDGFWFDRVIHVLYFPDDETGEHVRRLVGGDLVRMTPSARVETPAGCAAFPLQLHLGGLQREVAVRCAEGFVRAGRAPSEKPPASYEEMLRRSFGEEMCEAFFFPYNRKMWKRPLGELAPSGFHWNIARPSVGDVLRGLAEPEESIATYNSAAWYPRPPQGAPMRGMECLTQGLAARAFDVRLEHEVESINLAARVVTARHRGQTVRFRFRSCCSTLPLPRLTQLCMDVPAELKRRTASLVSNRVLSVALNVFGPRPAGRRHWHYFSDESLVFTRLVHLDLFDPDLAPAFGWPMLAEVTQRAEDEGPDEAKLVGRVVDDVVRSGQLPSGCRVADANVISVEPAYVVFSRGGEPIVAEARQFFRRHGIEPLGRYGRWEYSSMGQVIRDALAWARNLELSRRGEARSPGRMSGAAESPLGRSPRG